MTFRKILFVGDSHTGALHAAFKQPDAAETGPEISIYRLSKIKNNTLVGDISFDDFQQLCGGLDARDLVVSVIGGNQHASLSLIQHEQPYDVFDADGTANLEQPGVTWLPRNMVKAHFERGMRGNDGRRIKTTASSGPHKTIHLAPPPPKADTTHILSRVETDFAARGIAEKGVSPAPLRQRMWEIQNEVMRAILAEDSIDLLPPPKSTMTPDGFLHPDYYAKDATHANAAYGAKVLDQILTFAAGLDPVVG